LPSSTQGGAIVSEYQLAPEGEHVAEIICADRRRVPWRVTARNEHGDCICVRLRLGVEYGFVFCDIPADLLWLRRRIATAVAIDGDELVPEVLAGRQARVEIEHIVTRDGRTKAVVKKWLPPARSAPAAPAPRRGDQTSTLVDAIEEWKRQPPPRPTGQRSRNAVKRHVQGDDDFPF
jgi:hypothetical protein